MKHSTLAAPAALLALFMACGVFDQAPQSVSNGWVQVGVRSEWQVLLAPERANAVKAWRAHPDENAARALARAYYPEFFGLEKIDADSGANAAAALSVKMPEHAGEPMEIFARGRTFRITRLGSVAGEMQFWAAAGPAQRAGGRLVAQRIEEYDVLEGGPAHRATYRIELPPGIAGLRDTGEWLEFGDGQGGPPVLRMHYPQVRDARGTVRTGIVEIRGVTRAARQTRSFVAAGPTVDAALSVDLDGLQAPLVVDPGWSTTATMAVARTLHTATLLPSGKVLVAGGWKDSIALVSTELYDPATGTWAATGAMATARHFHSAILLSSGKVLVAGGGVVSAELYDPGTGTWTATGAMSTARGYATTTLLASGKVLVAGGCSGANCLTTVNTAELYDPGSGTWTVTSAMSTARESHTATLLTSGKVLVVGGCKGNNCDVSNNSTELFDPGNGTWAASGSLADARETHVATLLPSGKVLVAGGWNGPTPLNSAELFDPGTGTWTATGPLATRRGSQTATLLPSGRVLIVGGWSGSASLPSAELYNPGSGAWVAAEAMTERRQGHTATLLPTGKVFIAGGSSGTASVATAELYDPGAGAWTATSAVMTVARGFHSATLLPSGNVLVAGGCAGANCAAQVRAVELYDPGAGTWTGAAAMTTARDSHTATLLPSGKVLVAGGGSSSAELFDPGAGSWTAAAAMTTGRGSHTATLLPSGKVLVTGGLVGATAVSSAELFDPSAGTWTATVTMAAARHGHTATLLRSGKVLVAGGCADSNRAVCLGSAELYDPSAGTWTTTAATMTVARGFHTATPLPSGRCSSPAGGPTTSPSTRLNSLTRAPTPGRPPSPWSARGPPIRPPCFPLGRCSSRAGGAAGTTSILRNCMTRALAPGRPPNPWPPGAVTSPPPCCPRGSTSSLAGGTEPSPSTRRNCMRTPGRTRPGVRQSSVLVRLSPGPSRW